MGARESRTGPPRVVRAAAIGATVAALATGGWTVAAAQPVLPLLPEVPTPGHTYVTPGDPHGFDDKDTIAPGTVEFGDALGAPPGGNADALVLTTPDGGSKASFLTGELAGPLSNFMSSSYYAKRDSSSTGDERVFPSFQIPVDKNGGALEDGDFSTLTFEPIYQTGPNANVAPDSWNRYDTGIGLFCSTRKIGGFDANQIQCGADGKKPLAEIIADNPGITALGAGVNQGRGNPGVLSAVDLFQVGGTTYNFERKAPVPPVVIPEEPMEPENPCEPKPDDPGEHPGHPNPDHGHPDGDHPGKGDHPHKGDGAWGEDPKSHPPSHPGGEDPKSEHPGGHEPGGEHPDGEDGGEHPHGPKPPTCES